MLKTKGRSLLVGSTTTGFLFCKGHLNLNQKTEDCILHSKR